MPSHGEMTLQKTAQDTLTVALSGSWKLTEQLPSADEVRQKLEAAPGIGRIAFDSRQLAGWDSGLLIFLTQVNEFCAQKKIAIEGGGLPEGARKMLALAAAVPEKKDARKAEGRVGFLTHVGSETVDFFRSSGEILAFIGDTVIAFLRLLRGRAQYRKTDLWLVMEACGGAGVADRLPDLLSGGIDSGLYRCHTAEPFRGADLRGRSGGYCDGAADGGDYDRCRRWQYRSINHRSAVADSVAVSALA